MFQKRVQNKPKWAGRRGAQAVVRGGTSSRQRGTATLPPLGMTALVDTVDLFCISVPDLSKPHFSPSLFFHQSLFNLNYCNT